TVIYIDNSKYGVVTNEATLLTSPCTCSGGASGCNTPGIDAPPSPAFNAGAVGNIDADSTVDIWTISSGSRVFTVTASCTADANNPSGEPANDQNDVNL